MNDQSYYLLRAIRFPILLITFGVLFAVDSRTQYGFGQTWPILLIVFGLLHLAGAGRRRDRNSSPASNDGDQGGPRS